MSGALIRIEEQPRKSGGPRFVRIYLCEICKEVEVRVRGKVEKVNESRRCQSCSHQKRPFESIYNGLFHDHRKHAITLTYDEYLEFTNVPTCHYCDDLIPWQPYGTVRGNFMSRSYFLDQIIPGKGYHKDNCVVCCTECNRLRSNKFSYEEFVLIGQTIKQIRKTRKAV